MGGPRRQEHGEGASATGWCWEAARKRCAIAIRRALLRGAHRRVQWEELALRDAQDTWRDEARGVQARGASQSRDPDFEEGEREGHLVRLVQEACHRRRRRPV